MKTFKQQITDLSSACFDIENQLPMFSIIDAIGMKAINEYEPDNKLQKAYDKLWGSCLCGHSEWCCYCDGSLRPVRAAIEEVAETLDYQLYIGCHYGSPQPILRNDK